MTPSAAAAAERLGRRHLGGVVGLLDLTTGDPDVAAWGSTGRADDAAVDPQTLFEIGSVTKTVTALTLAVLVETGTVRLDTPVRTLLPEETDVPRHGTAEITLEHLARHISGLPRSPTSITHDLWVAFVEAGNPYAELDEASVLAIDRQHPVANCSLTELLADGGRLRLTRFNAVDHLVADGGAVTEEPRATTFQ